MLVASLRASHYFGKRPSSCLIKDIFKGQQLLGSSIVFYIGLRQGTQSLLLILVVFCFIRIVSFSYRVMKLMSDKCPLQRSVPVTPPAASSAPASSAAPVAAQVNASSTAAAPAATGKSTIIETNYLLVSDIQIIFPAAFSYPLITIFSSPHSL